ncbi:MAG: hypothetical protein EOO50_14125 [Flavobacterium sp.]|uniref:hypothetical protein n=1 Tax=Flavobacterium sp. TaxID=239 RepID=UPI0011FB31AA|nr:hypothetical protein [Flavobacterium sp.]RZJ65313.1 MAG: hypothetical protein EOO50_14125 [Flavobacterium sp.]
MKKPLLFVSAFAGILFASCGSDDSSSAVTSVEKYISSVQTMNTDDDVNMLNVTYNAAGQVTSVSDGENTNDLSYSGGNLTTISGDSDPFQISELYQNPYDGYEFGEVLDYDNNGNPIKLRLFERDEETNEIIEEFEGFITYDNKPNPFWYTLQAAGIIDVLENVELNFSSVPQAEELIMAKQLLFKNNPKSFVLKHLNGTVASQVNATFVYGTDGYATSGTFTSSNEDGETSSGSINFNYLP